MNNIRIIPTFLRIQVDEKSHKMVGTKLYDDKIELKLKSYFDIK